MDKSELITDIETRLNGTVLVSKLIEGDTYFNHYEAIVKIIKNLVAEIQSVQYFVFDEGTGGEEAYYRIEVPVLAIDISLSTNSFRETVETNINNKVTAGAIEKGTVVEINEEQEKAVVSVYVMDTGILYNRLYLVWNDKDSVLQFEQIVQE